jgi:hypothetical protein
MLVIPTLNREPWSVAFSPDGRLLALGGVTDGLTVCDATAGKAVGSLRLGAGYHGWDVDFTPDGRLVLNANGHFGWRAIDWTSGESIPLGPAKPDSPVAMDRDGDWVVLSTVVYPITAVGPWRKVKLFAYRLAERAVPLWAVEVDAALVPQVKAVAGGEAFVAVEYRAFRSTGPSNQPTLTVRARADGRLLAEGPIAAETGYRLAVRPGGSHAAACAGSRVLLWDLDDPTRKPLRLVSPTRKHVRHAAFSPDGRWLAAGGNDGRVTFWDVDARKVAKSFDWSAGRVTAVAFSPDGLRCAAGSETGQVVVWDVD